MLESSLPKITFYQGKDFIASYSSPLYHILLLQGEGRFVLDFTEYSFSGPTALCFSPYQSFSWLGEASATIATLAFHGDFYCIEYHKKEVACNGLLFNNIYLFPHIELPTEEFEELQALFEKLKHELPNTETSNATEGIRGFSKAVLRAYLQLILAICSRYKQALLDGQQKTIQRSNDLIAIQEIIGAHFRSERSPSFYAALFGLSPSAFSKKTAQLFGKSPTALIRDQMILEAKKLLHLTNKPIKEIAGILRFDDEFYFSRYFKKAVGISPTHYRREVGISIMAPPEEESEK